jgi:hypothetical protein
MAPFPQADHCIGPDRDAEALYRRYGGLFQALVGAKWLLRAHAANVTAPARVNVFERPSAVGSATLWAVMLGGNQTAATLSVQYLPSKATVNTAREGAQRFEVRTLTPAASVEVAWLLRAQS